MNRITPHFDELEFITALERTGAVRIEPIRPLVPVGAIGDYEPPAVPNFDYAHNVAGVGTERGCETPIESRRRDDRAFDLVTFGVCLAAVAALLLWSFVGMCVWNVMKR